MDYLSSYFGGFINMVPYTARQLEYNDISLLLSHSCELINGFKVVITYLTSIRMYGGARSVPIHIVRGISMPWWSNGHLNTLVGGSNRGLVTTLHSCQVLTSTDVAGILSLLSSSQTHFHTRHMERLWLVRE